MFGIEGGFSKPKLFRPGLSKAKQKIEYTVESYSVEIYQITTRDGETLKN